MRNIVKTGSLNEGLLLTDFNTKSWIKISMIDDVWTLNSNLLNSEVSHKNNYPGYAPTLRDILREKIQFSKEESISILKRELINQRRSSKILVSKELASHGWKVISYLESTNFRDKEDYLKNGKGNISNLVELFDSFDNPSSFDCVLLKNILGSCAIGFTFKNNELSILRIFGDYYLKNVRKNS